MNLKNYKYQLGFLAFVIIFWGCASSGTLTGGPEDEEPPVLNTETSTPNYKTNFTKQDIVFEFDEYIELKNASKELVVSPPLDYRIQTKVRGKKLTLSFNEKEELVDSVTYIISFGESIQDFRAANKLENFKYVFSTGNYIDSLQISGNVKDFDSDKAVDKALVMLYLDRRDSAVIEHRPFYFTKTDTEGNFKLENLKADSFRLYVCDDPNTNYTFNVGKEKIGFLSEDIVVDSANINNVNIVLSQPKPPLRVLKVTQEFKHSIDILFNRDIDKEPEVIGPPEVQLWQQVDKDTMKVWYATELDSFNLELQGFDTLNIYSKTKESKLALNLLSPKNSDKYVKGDTMFYTSNIPLVSFTLDSTTMLSDTSGRTYHFELFIDEKTGMRVGFIPAIDSNAVYQMVLDSGVFTSLFSTVNDSMGHNISIFPEDQLSNVKIKIYGFDSLSTQLIKVKAGSSIIYKGKCPNRDTLTLDFTRIVPTELLVEIITDMNNNGVWDGANIWGRIQAEKIYTTTIPQPKPNWSIEEDIDLQANKLKILPDTPTDSIDISNPQLKKE